MGMQVIIERQLDKIRMLADAVPDYSPNEPEAVRQRAFKLWDMLMRRKAALRRATGAQAA